MQKSSISYSPEIDGLRAIAVLSVLFFHLGIPGFSGGFIGQDLSSMKLNRLGGFGLGISMSGERAGFFRPYLLCFLQLL